MKIYLAGTTVTKAVEGNPIIDLFKQGSKLHSYYYSRTSDGMEAGWFRMSCEKGVDLFLDSGAYSAVTRGVEIDVNNYIDFIKQHRDCLGLYANLDVISSKGTQGTEQLTFENQKIMEEAGLEPVPVFHAGEDESYLEYYIENYDYIGLGGMVGAGGNQFSTRSWLDRIFRQYICDRDGWPRCRVHGFGITTIYDMTRYPWYSVDSTTWVVASRTGGVYVPRRRNGQWVYDSSAWVISVSNTSSSRTEAGKHFENLKPKERQMVLDYLESIGHCIGESEFETKPPDYTPDRSAGERWLNRKPSDPKAHRTLERTLVQGVSNSYQKRDEVNIRYFLDLQNSLPEWPTRFAPDGGVRAFGM